MNRIVGLFGSTQNGWAIALVLTSALFGFSHLNQGITGVSENFIDGLILGILYLASSRSDPRTWCYGHGGLPIDLLSQVSRFALKTARIAGLPLPECPRFGLNEFEVLIWDFTQAFRYLQDRACRSRRAAIPVCSRGNVLWSEPRRVRAETYPAEDPAGGNASGLRPPVDSSLRPNGDRNCADVPRFADEISDHPVFLSNL
jgi:hypothetical protein